MFEQIARNKRRTVIYVALFAVTWLGIGAAIGALVASTSTTGRTRHDVIIGLVIAAVAAAAAIGFTVHSGSRLVLAIAGRPARRHTPLRHVVPPGRSARVRRRDTVHRRSISSTIRRPNAFATGMHPHRAAVTVTTGLLAIMDREELEGVLAHEMSHIRNYDTRLLLVVSTLIGMAGLARRPGLAQRVLHPLPRPRRRPIDAARGRRRCTAVDRRVRRRPADPACPVPAPRIPRRRQRRGTVPQPRRADPRAAHPSGQRHPAAPCQPRHRRDVYRRPTAASPQRDTSPIRHRTRRSPNGSRSLERMTQGLSV